jgi:hypothetical protein
LSGIEVEEESHMAALTCVQCGTAIGRNDETCCDCGALTPLGWRREREHREEFEKKGRSPSGLVVLGLICVIAIVVAMMVLLPPA